MGWSVFYNEGYLLMVKEVSFHWWSNFDERPDIESYTVRKDFSMTLHCLGVLDYLWGLLTENGNVRKSVSVRGACSYDKCGGVRFYIVLVDKVGIVSHISDCWLICNGVIGGGGVGVYVLRRAIVTFDLVVRFLVIFRHTACY